MSGAEFSLLSLLKGIDRKQFRPVLLLPEEGMFADRARELGIEFHIIPSMIRFGEAYCLSNLLRVLKTIRQIVKIIQRQQIQIVHANSPRAAYIGGLAGRLAGVSTLTHVRDIEQSPFSFLTKSRILGFLSDKIIAVSKATADAILKVNPCAAQQNRSCLQWHQYRGNRVAAQKRGPEPAGDSSRSQTHRFRRHHSSCQGARHSAQSGCTDQISISFS